LGDFVAALQIPSPSALTALRGDAIGVLENGTQNDLALIAELATATAAKTLIAGAGGRTLQPRFLAK
jgi:hypothetical protein